jgi:hypothetical protein
MQSQRGLTFPPFLLLGVIAMLGCTSGLQQQLASANAERFALQRERQNLVQQNQDLAYNLRQMTERLNKHEEQDASTLLALTACRDNLQQCESRRLELENADVGQLTRQVQKCTTDLAVQNDQCQRDLAARVQECAAAAPDHRARGFAEGQLSVLNAIEIIGVPEREKGIIFDDYFYVFQVKVGNRRVVLTRIRTHKEETAFGSLLGGIKDIAMVFATRK